MLTVVSRVPPGRVTTYGDVAALAGRPRAARAVGNILARAERPDLPYHRVIAAGGALGGYSDLALKRSLLAAEGIPVGPRRIRDFVRLRWVDRKSSPAIGSIMNGSARRCARVPADPGR